MINWDDMPEWADRVVVGPCSCKYYWANIKMRSTLASSHDLPNNDHIKENWKTIWPPSHDTEEHTGLSVDFPKQERYKDHDGEDWIDECARTFTKEEFRGAMKFTIGKYNRRLGRKDDITSEVTKIADYANRWLKYERENNQ